MNFKKLLSLLLAALICISLFAACDKNEVETTATTEAANTEASETETNTEAVTNSTETTEGSASAEGERFDYFNANIADYATIDTYKGLTATLSADYIVNEEAVTKYIAELLNYYPSVEKVTDRAVADGDTVYIYFEDYENGVAFEGGSNMTATEPSELVIGSGSFIPGFEEGLIGIVPAETSRDNLVDLNLTFPEDYHNADMAGKSVVFKVYIEYIAESKESEYTAEFITDVLGFTAQGDDLFGEFEAYIETLLYSYQDSEIKNQVWNQVLSGINVTKYPEGEVEYYYESYLAQYEYYRTYYSSFGISFDTLGEFVIAYLGLETGADWEAYTREQCELGIKQNLAFHYIAEVENMIITDTDYQNALQYYVDYYASSGYSYTADEIEANLGANMIKEQALFDKVTALLVENCTVEYVSEE